MMTVGGGGTGVGVVGNNCPSVVLLVTGVKITLPPASVVTVYVPEGIDTVVPGGVGPGGTGPGGTGPGGTGGGGAGGPP